MVKTLLNIYYLMKVRNTGSGANPMNRIESSHFHHPKTPLGGNAMAFSEFSQTPEIEEQSHKKTPIIDSSRKLL
jgi:hypothetical protein